MTTRLPQGGFCVGVLTSIFAACAPAEDIAQFGRDIRPIFSDVCFRCHGPDGDSREAELRLDTRESAFANLEGRRLIVPGQPERSELIRRITSSDPDERMPPSDSRRQLDAEEIDLIRRWVEQGAEWQEHWAFVAPRRPKLPRSRNTAWCQGGVDHFVLARLEREGLAPSQPCKKETLIRRVSFDLTGLPPTLEEVDAFLADDSADAYEKVVDRLLKSPRYGERMAFVWLEAARYADTSGYQNDGPRYMWRWRDWVIDAFNDNMPFDQFTVEQIAGDMLPGATLQQQIATGFNRNHRGNAEGGIIPEEFQVEYVVDRVDTTATVWLGLTLGCARCHDHKYDPISQKEFYQVFAYFNNIPEYGRAIKEGNSRPFIKAPTRAQQQLLAEMEDEISIGEQRFEQLRARVSAEQLAWEGSQRLGGGDHTQQRVDWQPTRGLLAHYPLDGSAKESTGLPTRIAAAENNKRSSSVKFVDGGRSFEPGQIGHAASFDGRQYIDVGDVARFGYFDAFSVSAWIFVSGNRGGTVVSRMTDELHGDGWYLQVEHGRLQFNLVKRWLDDSIRVESSSPIQSDEWCHVAATYDGSRSADAITLFVNGKPVDTEARHDFLNQTFANDAPLRIGGGNGPTGRFHGLIDDLRIHTRALTPAEVAMTAVKQTISQILTTPAKDRTAEQSAKLREYFLQHHASATIRAARDDVIRARLERQSLVDQLPTLMVMQEMAQPRETFVLTRGQYNEPSERVTAGVPAVFPSLPVGAPNNRLGFGRWLAHRANPLAARVAVNRLWQLLFGTGLVRTAEDFGTQGERPSHPQLLDWLAVEFMESGWDTKRLLKTIVMSATYRQSSKQTTALQGRDPTNRLLARGPRIRLSAEMIRDQALAISGLLTEKLGGPSVRPYQPAGLWTDIATDTDYEQSNGPDLYRRSLYTYWKRTAGPPNMMTLDASAREACTVRQSRTNTPLQALALMNDKTFVEAARVFAERTINSGGANALQRIGHAFRLATSRAPGQDELEVLGAAWEFHLANYRQDKQAAAELTGVGEYPRSEDSDVAELAAYTAVCSMILNLDETMTKE